MLELKNKEALKKYMRPMKRLSREEMLAKARREIQTTYCLKKKPTIED